MTEQMFGRVPLNLVVTAIKDGTHGTHARVDNGIPFLSAKNITDSGEVSWNETDDRISDSEYEQIHRVFQLQPRDLLLTIVGSLGRRAVFDGAKVTFQRSVAYVRPDRRRVSERFLFHWFAHAEFQRELVRRSNSTAQAGLYLGELAQTLVPDCPLTEQIKIAEVLDTLDSTIRQTQAIIDKLKQVKQGLLHDLLTRGIADNGELRPPQSEAPHLYKESALGWIPLAWEIAPLLSRIDLPQGQVDPRFKPYCDWVLVAPDHIESATGRLLAAVTAREQGAISGKYVCNPGDVIYSKIRPYLRKATLTERQVICSADMYPFTPQDDVNSRFLLALILGEGFSRFAESVSMRTGMPKINREELAECVVAWPTRAEQDAVVSVLTSADLKQQATTADLRKLTLLKSGLMDDLLTGRVRVTPLLLGAPA